MLTTYLSIDLGDARIGFATSSSGIIANGIETYQRKTLEEDFAHIRDLVRYWSASVIVMGLPLNMDGTEGDRAIKSREFAKQLDDYLVANNLKVKFEFTDERLTTVSGESMLISAGVRRDKRKKVIDKIAATIILQSYLDTKNNCN